MSRKRKRRTKRKPSLQRRSPRSQATSEELRQEGLRAFNAGRYLEAIGFWEKLDSSNDAVVTALAEACFRHATLKGLNSNSTSYLERATELAPNDPNHAYYLGLALHKENRLAEAMEAYQRGVASGLSRREASLVIALAALRLDRHVDLKTVSGVSSEDRQFLESIVRLWEGKPDPQEFQAMLNEVGQRLGKRQDASHRTLLNGLSLLAGGQKAKAHRTFSNIASKTLSPSVNAIRWYYAGVAAAGYGDMEAAKKEWGQAYRVNPNIDSLLHNISAAYAQQSVELSEAGDWQAAAQTALNGLKSAEKDSTLTSLALVALDRAASDAAQSGDWATATQHWTEARQVLTDSGKGGSPRPILHNLALAYEALEQWQEAAEAWRAMLRTRPRKRKGDGFGDEHWTWVRKQVIECYKRSGQPDEAITIFRQLLKADPGDLDARFSLVDALLANDQEQAAINELNRLIDRHPKNVKAMSSLAEIYLQRGEWWTVDRTLRQALKIEPDNQDVRSQLARLLFDQAVDQNEYRNYKAARSLLKEALQYTPDDYDLHLMLARVEFNSRKLKQARKYIEQALELGQDDPDAYQQAFICWLIEGDLQEARKVLTNAETQVQLTAEFHLDIGIKCLERAAPPEVPDMHGLLNNLGDGLPPKPPVRKETPPNERTTLGHELLERAIALGPEVEILRGIVLGLHSMYPQLAIPYARRLTEISPEDAMAWFMLGLSLGLDQQVKEAEDTLRKATRMAHKQGEHLLAQQARDIRREVVDPLFSAMWRLTPLLEDFPGPDFDFDFPNY